MDFSIASILLLDGFTNGAVYALLGLATVLVFTVTRVIFIPQGEFVAYGALTLAIFQTGQVPGTVWLLLIMAALAAVLDARQSWQHSGNAAKAAKAAKDDAAQTRDEVEAATPPVATFAGLGDQLQAAASVAASHRAAYDEAPSSNATGDVSRFTD